MYSCKAGALGFCWERGRLQRLNVEVRWTPYWSDIPSQLMTAAPAITRIHRTSVVDAGFLETPSFDVDDTEFVEEDDVVQFKSALAGGSQCQPTWMGRLGHNFTEVCPVTPVPLTALARSSSWARSRHH